jgi:hypothetical protein
MEVFLIVLVTIAGAGAAFFLFVIEPRRKIYDYDPPRPSVKSVTDGVSEPSRPSSVYLIHPVIVRADEFGWGPTKRWENQRDGRRCKLI